MNHQKLKCYEVLMDVARMMPKVVAMMPRGSYYLEDQLKRALSSAVLNLSEGNGRRSNKERNRFFDISLASIAETSSAIDLISAYGYIPDALDAMLREKLRISYCMIMKLRARI
jgi:four helix bundle protein